MKNRPFKSKNKFKVKKIMKSFKVLVYIVIAAVIVLGITNLVTRGNTSEVAPTEQVDSTSVDTNITVTDSTTSTAVQDSAK